MCLPAIATRPADSATPGLPKLLPAALMISRSVNEDCWLQEVMQIADYGGLSVIRDPTGAVIALWQPKAAR